MDEILLNFYILKSKCTIKTRKTLSGIETGKQYQRMEENKKSANLADSLLRCYAVDVSREHGTFFDVRDAQETSRDTLQTDSETSVRGHAVLEGIEVEMERIGVHAATDHLLSIVGFFMDTLTT